jgi:hypothetical protein
VGLAHTPLVPPESPGSAEVPGAADAADVGSDSGTDPGAHELGAHASRVCRGWGALSGIHQITSSSERRQPLTHPMHTPNAHTQCTHPMHTPNAHTQCTRPTTSCTTREIRRAPQTSESCGWTRAHSQPHTGSQPHRATLVPGVVVRDKVRHKVVHEAQAGPVGRGEAPQAQLCLAH